MVYFFMRLGVYSTVMELLLFYYQLISLWLMTVLISEREKRIQIIVTENS